MQKKPFEIIWLDMDGVLCNYIASSIRVYRKHKAGLENLKYGQITGRVEDVINITGKETKNWIDAEGPDFWAELEKYDWVDELFRLCKLKADRVGILTNPGRFMHATPGKYAWLLEHGYYHSKMPVVFAKEKEFFAKPGSLLIDDLDSNCEAFIKNGGDALAPKRPWNKSETTEEDILIHLNSI